MVLNESHLPSHWNSPWQEGEPTALQHHYSWMDTWQNFYEAEPLVDTKLTAEERQRVIGGMAEIWGEQVSVDASCACACVCARA